MNIFCIFLSTIQMFFRKEVLFQLRAAKFYFRWHQILGDRQPTGAESHRRLLEKEATSVSFDCLYLFWCPCYCCPCVLTRRRMQVAFVFAAGHEVGILLNQRSWRLRIYAAFFDENYGTELGGRMLCGFKSITNQLNEHLPRETTKLNRHGLSKVVAHFCTECCRC